VENDPVVAKTYRLNHPEVLLYQCDVRSVSPTEMMEKAALERGQLTVLSVCAPCQPFSRQNRYRLGDTRAPLILETIRFVSVLLPVFVFLENVPGLKECDPILKTLTDGLSDIGYLVEGPKVVDAVNYGVPQFRKRLILLAGRYEKPAFPKPTHLPPEEAAKTGKARWRTVADAFVGLPKLASGEKSEVDPLHRARRHASIVLERLKYIPHNGGSRHELPPHLQLTCHCKGNAIGYNDVYGRMAFDRPSNTLTGGCTNVTKGRFAHPVEDRAITPREAARLQTFPDWYEFFGSYGQVSEQIGNAVPVLLAETFARVFFDLWQDLTRPEAPVAIAC
ncbi:MAG TPA: DNA cytosine methyltransferase, partial [Clostridia bacterium]|nr:DNA cytosine methyltransferase [Clostridia bacterium]